MGSTVHFSFEGALLSGILQEARLVSEDSLKLVAQTTATSVSSSTQGRRKDRRTRPAHLGLERLDGGDIAGGAVGEEARGDGVVERAVRSARAQALDVRPIRHPRVSIAAGGMRVGWERTPSSR